MQYTPLIIIGAPRSGTNMIRDVLTSLPGLATWPCDEINCIWRHKNVRHQSDEFTADMARPEVCRYIRKQIDWVAIRYKVHTMVEKTCANSLRVGFVDRVVPEARYIFIRRDGLDAVGSAMKRWKAPLDLSYLAQKARFVPMTDLIYYGGRYFWNRFYRVVSREKRLAFWGPKLEGMDELLAEHSLDEVCAIQWQRCVDAASVALSEIPNYRWIEIGYEDFVRNPENDLKRILNFFDLNFDSEFCKNAVAGVTSKNIGKGREQLGERGIQRLKPLIQDTMVRYGYF